MMPRPQFTLRALLVAMLVVAAFFGGMALQKQLDAPTFVMTTGYFGDEVVKMRDGTLWQKIGPREDAAGPGGKP